MQKKRLGKKIPTTMGIRQLKRENVQFTPYLFEYIEHGGSKQCSMELGIDEHDVVKTLVMEDERKSPFIVLMHGDKKVSFKKLARIINVKTVSSCSVEKAEKITGYKTGGISPFGIKEKIPIYMEKTIACKKNLFINGGKRGFILKLTLEDFIRILNPIFVDAGIPAY